MSRRSDLDLLQDIREAISRIISYTVTLDYEGFLADTKTQDAVIRNLEIIGEATKNLSTQIREDNPTIPWRGMAGLWDRLIHQYFGVNLDIIWQICLNEIPDLIPQLEPLIGQQ
jgi:uncharacterized protein with HEPN domain